MERILIIGGNGCGKTTFAIALSKKLQLPLVHLDQLFWTDGWQHVSDEDFDKQLIQQIVKPQWIIDGNIRRTIPLRLQYCDTVLYFDFSRLACVCGVIQRVVKNHGKSRFDMGGYCPEKFDFAFLKAVWNFNKTNRTLFYKMLGNTENVHIAVLKNRTQVKKFLEKL